MGYFMVIHPLVIPWFAMIWHGKYTIWGIHREYVSLVWRNVREKISNYTLKTWTYVYNNYIKDWGQSTQIPIFYSQCDIEQFLNMENWRIPSFSRDTQCKRLTKRCRDWWSVASHKMTTGETKNHWLVVWNHGILWLKIGIMKPRIICEIWKTMESWFSNITMVFHIFETKNPEALEIGDLTTGKCLNDLGRWPPNDHELHEFLSIRIHEIKWYYKTLEFWGTPFFGVFSLMFGSAVWGTANGANGGCSCNLPTFRCVPPVNQHRCG